MKKILISKIFRRMLILSILVIGLAFVTFSNESTQSVMARPCCEDCAPDYDSCMMAANGDPDGEYYCAYYRNSCQHWCITCNYGGNGCDGDYDCGPAEQCSSSGTCVPR